MFIKTRKLPATQTDGERMRATDADTGAVLTVPFPGESLDPHRDVAVMLARAYGREDVTRVLSYNTFQA